MQLLQDTFIIENLTVLSEGKNNGKMRVKGIFGRCNEKNNNGRIYPTSVLESQLQKVQPLINERRLCGELDHPQNDTVKLSNASHLITNLIMKGNELIGEAEILDTPAGLTAQALIRGGVKIGISSRGMGTLSEDANGDKIVNEDYRLVTFDLVADPSTRGAFPGLSESTESKFVKDSQDKLSKEGNLVTMLKSKLREAYKPYIEEACDRKDRVKAVSKERNKRDQASMKNTGKWGEEGERLDKEGKKLPGKRKPVSKFMKEAYMPIANAIKEAFSDELDSAEERSKRPAAKSTGSFIKDYAARKHAEKMEIAKAKGNIKAARMVQKAKERAKAGKPVTGGEAAAKLAGDAGKAVKSGLGKITDRIRKRFAAKKEKQGATDMSGKARNPNLGKKPSSSAPNSTALTVKKPQSTEVMKHGTSVVKK